MLLNLPQACHAWPLLTLDGVAVTAQGQHYLILTFKDMTRCYIGPDQTTVQRRAELVAAALARRLGPIQAAQVGAWVEWAWEALLDELVDAISTDLKELWP